MDFQHLNCFPFDPKFITYILAFAVSPVSARLTSQQAIHRLLPYAKEPVLHYIWYTYMTYLGQFCLFNQKPGILFYHLFEDGRQRCSLHLG